MIDRRTLIGGAAALEPAVAWAVDRQTVRTRLIGSWKLKDAVTVNTSTGETSVFFGWRRPYSGILVYGASGDMSAQLCANRENPVTGGPFKGMDQRLRIAYLDTYYSYFGRFEVDEAQSRVHHLVEASLDPTEVGLTYVRLVEFDEDVLKLSTTERRFSTGTGSVNRLSWTRA